MAMKQKGRKVYRTMQGKQIDLDLLIKRNELTPAVGNAKVNARGDELGPGGKIIRKKEEVVRDYYGTQPVVSENAKKTKLTAVEQAELEEFDSEPVPPKPVSSPATKSTSKKTDSSWIEDDEGNFIQKGE